LNILQVKFCLDIYAGLLLCTGSNCDATCDSHSKHGRRSHGRTDDTWSP